MDLQGLANNNYYVLTGYGDNAIKGMRTNMPGFGIKIPVEFNTGLGAPASFYADAQMQTMKVSYETTSDESKTSWMVGGGLSLPVYFVTLKGDVAYLRGFTGMSYIFGDAVGSSSSTKTLTPLSYWVDRNGSLQQTYATQWDVEAQIDFNKLAQVPFTLSGGYSQVVFSNLPMNNEGVQTNAQWISSYSTYPVRKASTIFANVSYNLTKSTMLGVEYDRNKTYYTADPNASFNSNAVYVVGVYNF
jgi:hypothetical protein